MFNLFKAIGIGCMNYDTANGAQSDLSDNITFAQVERDTLGGYLWRAQPVQNAAPFPNFTIFPDHLL